MQETDVLESINKVLCDINIMKDPARPQIMYNDLVEAVVKDEEGWWLHFDDDCLMFVNNRAGHEALHDAIFELASRFNGVKLHPNRNMGFRA